MKDEKEFWNELENFLIETNEEEEKFDLIKCYTLMRKNADKFKEIIEIALKDKKTYFDYYEDETEGYTDGKIGIRFNENQKSYMLSLSSYHANCNILSDISIHEYTFKGHFDSEYITGKDLKETEAILGNRIKTYKRKRAQEKYQYIDNHIKELLLKKEQLLKEIEI